MKRPGECAQSVQKGWSGSVQKVVADAEHALRLDCAHVLPATIRDNFGQGNTISGATPGCDKDIGIVGQDFFRGALGCGCRYVYACRGHFLQFFSVTMKFNASP